MTPTKSRNRPVRAVPRHPASSRRWNLPTRGYDDTGSVVLSLAGGSGLLGIEPVDGSLQAAVETRSGARRAARFHSGAEQAATPLADGALVRHRISRDVVIAAPDGKHSLIPNTSIARPATAAASTATT